jgi:TatD DNase family protein
MLIDTHAHLTMPEYSDLAEVVERAKEKGVEIIINASFDLESSQAAVRFAKEFPGLYAAVGIHPHDAHTVTPEMVNELKKLSQNPKVVAIGETGLDYHYTLEHKDKQKEVFREHLRLAQELSLPVIVHDREAHEDVMTIIREENRGDLKGVLHCFSGDLKLAQWAIDMGLYISFTGNVTFKKAQKMSEKVAAIPLEKLLLETDCPYLSPEPHRGERNEPAYLIHTAQKIAEIKNISLAEIEEITTQNAKKLFSAIGG